MSIKKLFFRLWVKLQKLRSNQGHQKPQPQSFILEPILTPSGLVDGFEESPEPLDIDPLPFEESSFDPDSEGLAASIENLAAAESLSEPLDPIAFIDNLDTTEVAANLTNATFDSGVFTVGESGEVSIDFLFDGGAYRGELAVFSLEGMEDFEPGSDAFIQEAAQRALSDSELGYIVISDRSEGARFSGELGERDWNRGPYLGVKTFEMRAGDEFGLMLVPHGKVEQVEGNPGIGGSQRPLFSMATANPDDAFHVGQIADITGEGNSFIWEDLRVDHNRSDGDYNDLIFQIRGATGEAIDLDEVINPELDWRDSELGQELIEFIKGEPTLDSEPPQIEAELANDSGISSSDLLTADPSITGSISDDSEVTSLLASLNSQSNPVEIGTLVDTDGSFSLDASEIANLNGGSLPDGEHTLFLQASDEHGNLSEVFEYRFTLDTTPPDLDVNLAPDSDTAPFGDNQTELALVTLVGQSEPNAQVTLLKTGASTTADENGQFQFADVPLELGNNEFNFEATDPAGNQSSLSETIVRVDSVPDILLEEESFFSVSAAHQFQVPDSPALLSFELAEVNFDSNDPSNINDAFEAALLDGEGNSLVHTIGTGNDAFFNLTEGESPELAPGVSFDGQTITVDLSQIEGGENATLELRLINNDSDTDTSARIRQIQIQPNPDPTAPVASAASLAALDTSSSIDFSQFADVSASVEADYSQTSFNPDSNILYAQVALSNSGSYSVDGPLLVAIDQISDPSVQPVNPDGFTPEGLPYYDFSHLLSGRQLEPGQHSDEGTLAFFNPNGEQFTYELVVLAEVNAPPVFESNPEVEVIAGLPYQYDADAMDANGDALSYELLAAPSGMTIDPETGLIEWATTPDDIANHAVVLQVSDGHGGIALQTFTLSVREEPPNRPPIFTSTPEVDAWINQLYKYDADAIDPDQDTLTYSLILGPDGMKVHPDSGEVEWTPPPVLNLGDTVLGQASIPGDDGEFRFSGVAGQRIYFDPLQFSGNAGDWSFEVYSPSGEKLLDTTLVNNHLLNLTESGNYRIVVDAQGDHTGSYGFSVIDLNLVPIAPLDTVIEGELTPGSEDDVYRFTGNGGQKLFFDQLDKSNSLAWVLYDANHQVVERDFSFNDMELYLPADGEYFLALQGTSRVGVTANYTFEIITPEEVTAPLSFGSNASPNPIYGEIVEKGEEDFYTFTGHPGQRLYFDRLFQDGTVPWAHAASIISPSGQTIFNHNLQSPHDPGSIIILDESGTYRVRLNGLDEQTGSYSYSLLDLDLASPIATDTTYNGTLDPGQATHLYQFAGSEGQRLYLDAPGDTSGANWTLYDSRDQRITGGSFSTDFEVVLSDSETYSLAIQGYNGTTPVDYSFEVITPDEVVNPLEIGQIVESEIVEKGEQDIYTFTGVQGQRLFLDTLQDKPFVEATLVGPSAQPVFSNVRLHDDNSRIPFTLPEDGTYQLIVDGFRETTDSYGFQLLDLDAAPDWQPETRIQGSLEPGRSIQVYQLSGDEGERLYFENQADSANGNRWRLYGPGNQQLADTRLNLDFETVLPATGTYYVLLQGEEDGPVPYDIQWVPTIAPATPLTLNSPIESELVKLGEQDRYTFTGAVGQTLYFAPHEGNRDIAVDLYNPSGNVVLSGDTSSDIAPLVLTEAGEYELIVDGTEGTTGTYGFILADTAPQLSPGSRLSGDLDAGEIVFYQFEGSSGQEMDFESLSSAPGADWILYAPTTLPGDNKVVHSTALNNSFSQVLPVDGRYILALRNFSEGGVSYDIQVTDISVSAVTTAGLDTLYSDTIATGGEVDVYPVDANAGSLILFDGQGNDSSQRVRLFNPDGTLVFSNLDNRNDAGPYQLTQTGSYQLEVYGQSGSSTGNYQFQLVELQAAPELTLNSRVDVALAAKETKVFQFSGSAGQQLWLDGLNTSNPNVTAKLVNSSGHIVANLNDLRNNIGLLTLEADDDYYLLLQSNNAAPTVASFNLLDAAAANSLPLDSDISGNFGTSRRETQLYRFSGSEDQRLYFDASGDRDNVYQVYGPDGQRLFSSSLFGDFEITALPNDGEYTLALIGTGKANNNYEMRIVTPDPSEIALTIGDTITGEITEAGEQTTYTFEGSNNQRLFFDSLAGEAVNATLYSPSGIQLWQHGTHVDRDPTPLNETGTYRLVIDGSQDRMSSYSFRLLDLDNATPISLDSEIADDFGASLREAHLYRFNGSAGQPLFFDRTIGDSGRFSGNNYYALYGPDGRRLLAQELRHDDETILPGDGEYTLAIAGNAHPNPHYALELVTPDWLAPSSYTIGDILSSTLSEAGERDTFTFTGNPGQQLLFDSLLPAASNLTAKLVAPSGNVVWQSQQLNADREPFTLVEAGTYTLEIDGSGEVVGDYHFRLLDLADATPISLDASLEGDFGASLREAQIYRFSASANQRLYFDRSAGDRFNSYALYDEHGQKLFAQGFNSDYEGTETLLPDTGDYTLVLYGNGRPNPVYDLAVVTPDVVTTSHQLGETLSGEIGEAGEQDIYTFEGTINQQLWFDSLDNTVLPLKVEVFAPSGEEIFDHALYFDGGLVKLPADGTYRIVVDGTNDATGDYGFRFLDATTADPLALDTTLSGDFGSTQQEAQIYTFKGNEAQYLYFDGIAGHSLDRYSLYDPDGHPVVSQFLSADTELELPQTGYYTLVVDGFHGENYQLGVITPVLEDTSLTLGEIVTGDIDEAGARDTYHFTGAVGQQLYFDPLGSNGDLRAQLYSPSGTLIKDWPTNRDDSPVTLSEAGSYRLVLDGSNTATGDYQFQLWDLAEVSSLLLDSVTEDTLDPGNATALYQLTGEPGQVLSFDLEADRWVGANWVLYGPGDTVIAAPHLSTPDFTVTLPVAGAYTLAIAGTSTTPLDYRFQVNDQTPAPIAHTGLNIPISGTLAAGAIIKHSFSASAGTQILLDSLNNSNNRIRFNLINPDGNPALSNFDSSRDSAPLLLTQSGNYTLQIYGSFISTTGDYALQLLELPEDSTSEQFNRLEPGTVTEGTLSPGLETELYSFEGITGQQLLLNNMTGNIVATLYAPTGEQIFSQGSDFGPLTLNQDGFYHLAIHSGGQASDRDYAFQLFNFDVGQSLPLNLPVVGHLSSGQQSKLYKFTGTAGNTLFFDSLQSSSNHFWKLYGPDSKQLYSNRLSRDFEAELPSDGEYTLLIEGGFSPNPLDYEFRVFRQIDDPEFVITPGTGETASNDDDALALFPIQIEVSDNQGGTDLQEYNLRLWPDPDNTSPVITSTPNTRYGLNQTAYRYQLDSLDADGDPLIYRLIDAPLGAIINADSGELLWFPEPEDVVVGETYDFTVDVSDGRGGSNQQSFSVEIHPTLGTIQGGVFEDLNNNGYRDNSLIVGDNPDFFFVIDTSGSMGFRSLNWGDPNLTLENFDETQLSPADLQFAAMVALIEQIAQQNRGGDSQIAIKTFGDGRFLDLDPHTPGSQPFSTPLADTDGDGIPNFREAFQNLSVGGVSAISGTEVTAALNLADTLPDDRTLNVIYMSDGFISVPNEGLDELHNHPQINVAAFAVGAGSSLPTMQRLDPDAIKIKDPNDTFNIFTGWDERYTTEPLMENVTVYLDLNNNGQLDAGEPQQRTQPDEGENSLLGENFFQFRFENLLPGTYTLRQVVPPGFEETAPLSGSYIDTITVDGTEVPARLFGNHAVERVNQAPSFVSTPPSDTLIPGEALHYPALATDPDPDRLTYDLPLAPEGMAIDPETGDLIWVPQNDQVGTYTVVLRVQDGQGAQALQAFDVEVVPPNTPPTFTSTPPDDAAPQVGKPFQYQATALDADGDALTYALLPDAPAGITLDPLTGLLLWTPLAGQLGQQEITLKVTDSRGGEATQTLALLVIEPLPNTAPAITSTPRQETQLGNSYLYRIEVEDPDGDPLSFNLVDAPEGMTIDADGLIVWTPTASQIGNHVVEVEGSDGQGGSDIQRYSLKVSSQAVNRPPSITSVPQVLTNIERLYQYQLEGLDPDEDVLFWSLLQAPTGMVIDGETGVLSWQPTSEQVGNHTITIQAIDALGQTAVQEFTLQVNGINAPPAIVSTPVTSGAAGQPYIYTVIATDPENDPLRFSLGVHPEGMTIDAGTGAIQWTPTAAGSQTVEVLVEDDQGGSNRQIFTLEVGAEALNSAPSITSTPLFLADTNQPYVYPVTATDPDGDNLTFELIAAPTGVMIDADTGEVTWTEPVLGSHQLVVGVTDGALGAAQGFTLTVQDNQPPVFDTSVTPPATAIPDRLYRHDVRAFDPNGGPLTYRLDETSAALGITLDEAGRLRWTPTQADAGSHSVTIEVVDAQGTTASQAFEIAVTADTEAPLVNLQVSNVFVTSEGFEANLGTEVSFQVLATDNVGIEDMQLVVDGEPVQLDANGLATVTVASVGTVTALAVATDAAGNRGEAGASVFVPDPSDTEGPQVSLDISHIEDGVITAPTDILGTVTDDNLEFYTLSIAPVDGSAPFVEIARGTDEVTADVLGEFDPTTLLNDSYVLRLTARDAGGNVSIAEEVVHVEGDLKLGNFQLSFVDLEIPVSGIPISVVRTYDSLAANRTDELGYGWRLEFRDTDLRTSIGRDEQYEVLGIPSKAFKAGTKVFVTPPGGERTSFTFEPEIDPAILELLKKGAPIPPGLILYNPKFVAEDGSELTLSVEDEKLIRNSETGEFYSVSGYAYNPAVSFFGGTYTLTTQEGIEYVIDGESGDLLTATDLSGNQLTFSDAGIISDTGVQVTFERDPQGRIKKIIDPRNYEVIYSYDEVGNLVEVIDQENNTIEYKYDFAEQPHYLTEIIDPLDNRPVVRAQYLPNGRLEKVFDIDGDPIAFEYDLNSDTQIIRDANGIPTLYEYDDRGNVIRQVNQINGITHETRFHYDESNNLVEIADPNGNLTTFQYDKAGNLTSRTETHEPDILNPPTTYYTYNQYGQTTSIVLTTGASFNIEYDYRGNLLSIEDGAGSIIESYVYDDRGRLVQASDPFGTTYYDNFDVFGNPRWMKDVSGEILTFAYDANGQLTRMTENPGTPEETISTFTYDGLGRQDYVDYGNDIWIDYGYEGTDESWTTVDSPTIGHIERKFNDDGSLGGWITADNQEIVFKYNSTGQLETEITPAGVTTYTYDSLGRIKSVINETTGVETIMHYDEHYLVDGYLDPDLEADNLIGQVSAREIVLHDDRDTRYITHYTYYADGQIKTMTDAKGETWSYRYTPTTTTITDPLGRENTTLYSPERLPVGIQYADGKSSTAEYLFSNHLAEGTDYLTEITDRSGRDRNFTYDEFGRLKTATDWGDTVYNYHYEENNLDYAVSVPTEENPNGELILAYDYNEDGDLETVTYLDDSQRTFVYDPVTNLLQRQTLPSGETVTYYYDENSELETRRVYSHDGEQLYEVISDWDFETGQLLSVTDPTGTTTYYYDPNTGALAGLDYPNHSSIRYERDQLGRVEKIVTKPDKEEEIAYITEYKYDANGNIQAIKDPNGGTTTFVFDEVNRLRERVLANGIKTIYTYKENTDFIEKITHYDPDEVTVLSSIEYIRADSGEPTKIVREDGTYVILEYDESLRLEKETYYDASGIVEEEIVYGYDEVGNRQTVSGGKAQGDYAYENVHQLTAISDDDERETYFYDDGGRLETINRDGEIWQLRYNADDLIVEVKNGDATVVEYTYDSAGRRIKAADAAGERDYIVAPLMGAGLESPHLIIDELNNPLAAYVYSGATPLMRLDQEGNPIYYLEDGMGSIVSLADGSGTEIAEFEYDSFGNLRNETAGVPEALGGDFRFQSQWLESSSPLYHFRARYYDPETGRFVSRDPVDIIEYEPESSNPYQFVYNNPLIYSDPTGEFTITELNLAESIEKILRNVEKHGKIEIQEKLRNEIKEIASNWISSILTDHIPLVDVKNHTMAGRSLADTNNPFEAAMTNTLCNVVRGSMPNFFGLDYLWFQPHIGPDGTPSAPGFNPSAQGSGCGITFLQEGGNNKPELIIKKDPPTDTSTPSFTLLEVKVNLDNKVKPGSRKSQFSRFINYASAPKRMYVPLVLYFSLKLSRKEERLKAIAANRGVLVEVVDFGK